MRSTRGARPRPARRECPPCATHGASTMRPCALKAGPTASRRWHGRSPDSQPRRPAAGAGRVEREALAAASALSTQDEAILEEDWLTVVAPVRPALAAIEAWRLDAAARGGASLQLWASGEDPWQRDSIAQFAADAAGRHRLRVRRAPVFAAVGPAGALSQERVAVGIVARTRRCCPAGPRHARGLRLQRAAGARAEAILLAVAPSPRRGAHRGFRRGDARRVRELMVARAATPMTWIC